MKKTGLVCLMFIALAACGIQEQESATVRGEDLMLTFLRAQAQGSTTVETWQCFDLYDSGKNQALIELTRGIKLRSWTLEEVIENLKAFAESEGATPKGPIEDMPGIKDLVERLNKAAPGQVSVAGVTYLAIFRIEGLNRRWYFGEELNYSFIITPDGWGRYVDFRLADDDGRAKARQVFKCVLSQSLPPAELPRWDSPQRQSHREKDPQKRPGRKRTADGWVYELE